ncbi:MAG TPA: hypothetical protein VFZ37_10775 [Jiangellaceae bacterium]
MGAIRMVPPLVVIMAVAGCFSGEPSDADRPSGAGDGDADGGEAVSSSRGADCRQAGEDAQPWSDEPSVELVTLADGSEGPAVRGAVYPRPDYEGEPWSQWGQGVVLEDGRFISAIGDHAGTDGNSFLYEYDPEDDQLTQISDVLSLTDHQDGETGYGKIHAQMVLGPCGEVYAATYWGSQGEVGYEGNYGGDVLLRLDPKERTVENMGVILEEHGIPSMAGWAEGGLLYAEAANPQMHDPQRGALAVLDMATGEQVFATDDEESHRGFRAMAVDQEGRVLFSRDDGSLARWDPSTEEVSETDITLPGAFLRAATPPAPDGTVYLVTQSPDTLFALEPDGELRELGEAAGYTASLAMAPDGSKLWYVPDAHGGAAERGTPLIEVDTETGEQRTIVELDPLAQEALGMSLGGTYNVAIDADGSTLYLGMNANEPGADSLFGEVVLVVVELE